MDKTVENTIRLFNPWWDNKTIDIGIERVEYKKQLLSSLKDRRITFLLGSRRVGKTYMLFQLIHHLIHGEAVNPQSILFLSLDNTNLKDIDLFTYVATHNYEYLFLDEIQYRENWQELIKSIYDLPGRSTSIICSGSSSALIHDKKALLTGRHTTIPVYPLSFCEFQTFAKTKDYATDIHAYMEYGGYPEYVLERHPTYLTELIRDIVEKDIVEQYDIRRKEPLFELLTLMAKHVGFRTSINKLSNVLGITDDTIKTYLEYLAQVYLIDTVYKYSPSLNDRIYSTRKYYFWDTGMRTHLVGFEDMGSLAENLVYVTLRKRYPQAEIFYLSDSVQSEVDFFVVEQNKAHIIEVKYESYRERIIPTLSKQLVEPVYNFDIVARTVVTNDLNTCETIQNVQVAFISLERFLSL